MRSFTRTLIALAVAMSFAFPAMALSTEEEIDHLLDFIAHSSCAFIRNGVTYGAEQAAAHVKDKYDYFHDDIHSAEDFIALAATKSALTGRPYLVQCDAKQVPAADWLKQELAVFRGQ